MADSSNMFPIQEAALMIPDYSMLSAGLQPTPAVAMLYFW